MSSETEKASAGAVTAVSVLSVLALMFYAITLATLSDLASSDAAGNAYAQAFGAIEVIALWLLLAVIALIAGLKGAMPMPAVFAAVLLIPASGFVAMDVLELLTRPHLPPFRWPLVILAAIPPLVVAYCFWALLPALRATIPARLAGGLAWGAVLLLSVAIVPLEQIRGEVYKQQAAVNASYAEAFAKLPADAPLWDMAPLLAAPDQTLASATLDRIRARDRRQNEAELMLARGDFPLGYLARFDLLPTPALCNNARTLLRQSVEPLVSKSPNSRPYSDIRQQVSDAVMAMKWLVGHECSCDAEAQAWQAMAEAYRDPGFDVVELRELRDPKALGRTMREYPERFDMLTPKAHLKAWLSFADKKELREQSLAGARKLDHRTADAIEMLSGKDEFAPYAVLEYLPTLELEPTPALCNAALSALHQQFSKIYRPKSDDPRQYRELLGRLGRGEHFTALIWLASHGCDANAVLSEAESLIGAYQPSPDGGLVLGRLERLHRAR